MGPLQHLLALAERVDIKQSEVLGAVGKPVKFVYFPIDGFISLVTLIDGKPVLEVGMVGREGAFGAQVILRVNTQPLHAVVQGTGTAWRVPLTAFQEEVERAVRLPLLIGHYLFVLMAQLASSAGCTRFHQIDARLSRWLLMAKDRAHDNIFKVTHEYLSFMLGVRREDITEAAGAMQERGGCSSIVGEK